MLMTLGSYVRRGKRAVRRLLAAPWLPLVLRVCGCLLLGFCLSAAALGDRAQPLVLGLLCAGIGGWMPVPVALGAAVGYWSFWGYAGLQGIVWTAVGLPLCIALGQSAHARRAPLLMPAIAALTVAVTGVIFQTGRDDDTPILQYFLRIGTAFSSAQLFCVCLQRRDAVADWACAAVGVLALAQIAPFPFLGLGFAAAGVIAVTLPLPAVAMAGLALDLAQVTPIPMTAVLCLSFLARLLPGLPKWSKPLLPALLCVPVMQLCQAWDMLPLMPLLLGSVVGTALPQYRGLTPKRGATGVAQVRLEMAAQVFAQTEQLLREVQEIPLDEQTLIAKAAERACGTCPCRRSCHETEQARLLSPQLLHRPLFTIDDIGIPCKKRGRIMVELRRCQDQYRMLKADRDRRREYHGAMVQQYRFLTVYLQELADALSGRMQDGQPRFEVQVAVCSKGKEMGNGDCCTRFSGPNLQYYVLLCDGMGTGTEAAGEAETAVQMLRRLLSAGFPASHALRSLNSLCALRGMPGAFSIDLAQIALDSGKTTLYKWGAAPSWLLTHGGAEKIGTAGAPPGLSITQTRETVERLSLRRGETLVMLSDGVAGEEAMRRVQQWDALSPGELATAILRAGRGSDTDDATVAVVRLEPLTTPVS